MSDYRNYDPNDPMRRDAPYDPDARAMNATWGWIAAAVFIVVVLAIAFGVGHGPNQVASNDTTTPPAATRMSPPANSSPPATAPIAPAPNSPAAR